MIISIDFDGTIVQNKSPQTGELLPDAKQSINNLFYEGGHKMIISIDFDGTIVQNQFPQIGELLPDAKQSINNLYDSGHKIIINTCRDGQHLLDAINFLLHNQIRFHRVNDNLPENTEKYGSNSRKIYAHRYIDDRNIGGFPGWPACIDDIIKTEAEYLTSLTPTR